MKNNREWLEKLYGEKQQFEIASKTGGGFEVKIKIPFRIDAIFVRLRRSTIVRIEQIKELHPLFSGEFQVVLKSGAKLSSSRRYRKNLDELLKS